MVVTQSGVRRPVSSVTRMGVTTVRTVAKWCPQIHRLGEKSSYFIRIRVWVSLSMDIRLMPNRESTIFVTTTLPRTLALTINLKAVCWVHYLYGQWISYNIKHVDMRKYAYSYILCTAWSIKVCRQISQYWISTSYYRAMHGVQSAILLS